MNRARDLIADHLGVSGSLIQDHVSFRELGADSLDIVSLTMAFEEAFDIQISDDQVEACTTVGDALRLLDELRSRGAPRTEARLSEPSHVRG